MPEDFPRHSEVRDQRAGLRAAMHHLEDAAAAPAGDFATWRAHVEQCMAGVQTAWDRHVVVTEASDGLFEQIRTDAPRLEPRIEELHQEHADLHETLTTGVIGDAPDADGVRGRINGLVGQIARHRQLGADVIFEAYSVDIGGGG